MNNQDLNIIHLKEGDLVYENIFKNRKEYNKIFDLSNAVDNIENITHDELVALESALGRNKFIFREYIEDMLKSNKANNLLELKDKNFNKHNIRVLSEVLDTLDYINIEKIKDEVDSKDGYYKHCIRGHIKAIKDLAEKTKLNELNNTFII